MILWCFRVVLVSLLLPVAVIAADETGRFAIKGIANTSCAAFTQAIKKGGAHPYMYGGWVHGFMTAENRRTKNTYDVMAWEDLETITGYLVNHCEKHPKESFAQAVFTMTAAIQKDRLVEISPPVEIKSDGNKVFVYREILRRLQVALKKRGNYDGPIDADYNETTRAALIAFQKAAGLKATGLPDQQTIHALLRSPASQ